MVPDCMEASENGSMELPASGSTPRLAWKWILEKLVELPDFGVAFINEVITTHVADIEDPHWRPLLERVALRNLEEMVVTNQIDSDAIPLLKALTGQDLGPATIASSVKQRFNKELVLRVQTEVVLSVLRRDSDEGENDWACFLSELERVFAEAEEDNRLLDRKRELSALLNPKNQTKATVGAYFEKFSLNKLKNDLYLFIDEKRESFKTMFLDQLSRDFLDANGTPFFEELGGVEKSTKVDTHAMQDLVGTMNVESLQALKGTHINEVVNLQEVGQNTELDEFGNRHDINKITDLHVLGNSTVSGKKRLRRKLLARDVIGDDEAEEAQEFNTEIKTSSIVPPTSIVNQSEALLRQNSSDVAIPGFCPHSGCFPVKHGAESLKQLSSLKREEDATSPPRNFGSEAMKTCSPPELASVGMAGAKVPLKDPSPTKKYVIVSDVESDADTQVVERLSIDDEDDRVKSREGADHHKNGAQSFSHSESGSVRGHSQNTAAAEAVKRDTVIVQSERKIMEDRRKEPSMRSPEAKIAQQEDDEKFVTASIPSDSQDLHKVEFLEVGSDGHEELCHKCGLGGELLCCDGCPIAVHFSCIEILGLRVPKSAEDDWYCPVCLSQKAALEAAEAEKAAAAAKEKLKSFRKESIKKRSTCERDALQHCSQEKAVKKSRLRVNSLQFAELDRTLKPQQQSEEKPKPKDSDPPKASLLSNILRKALHQPKQLGEEDSEIIGHDTLPEDKSQSERVASFEFGEDGKNSNDIGRSLRLNSQLSNSRLKSLVKNGAGSKKDGSAKSLSSNEDMRKPHKIQLSHDHILSRRNPLAASTSGLVKRGIEPFARFSKSKGSAVDSSEESAELLAELQEPGIGAGGCGEVEGNDHDEDLDEDRGEKSQAFKQGALFGGRRKLPGIRRKSLPWTREEEDALKEGVKRFSHNGAYGFQWKRILEYGLGRFDPSRTDVDLKDKWRNLIKGVS